MGSNWQWAMFQFFPWIRFGDKEVQSFSVFPRWHLYDVSSDITFIIVNFHRRRCISRQNFMSIGPTVAEKCFFFILTGSSVAFVKFWHHNEVTDDIIIDILLNTLKSKRTLHSFFSQNKFCKHDSTQSYGQNDLFNVFRALDLDLWPGFMKFKLALIHKMI